jgi:hypothetical protein
LNEVENGKIIMKANEILGFEKINKIDKYFIGKRERDRI